MKLYKKHVSDLGKVITGKTPRTSILENYGGKIPFLTPSDNLSEKFSPTTSKTLTKNGLNEVKNCLLPSKSICVSCIGSDLGKVVLTKKPTVTNQQFNSIVPNEENDADFIYYLMTVVGKHLNYLSKTSTAVPIINKSTFANYEIEIPNIKEQKRIGEILSSLDDKIELNRRINDNLEQQAQALFKSWFVDFEPFKEGKFVDSELGMIPENWRVCSAETIFKINIGKTPPRKEQQWFTNINNGNVKWISISDLGSNEIFIEDSKEYLTKEAISKFNIIVVPEDTILVSFKLTVGRVGISNCELTTNEAVARFYLPKSYFREYTYLSLKNYNYARLGSTSSIATAVNSKIIKNMKLLIPPVTIISEFSKRINPLFNAIRIYENEIRNLSKIRNTLLPKLMSGELKINDINN
ncbi:restriction endonuclease subunit S [Prevotella histicola]|uniref:restriction endonuclease subunit S n=2 Tax=Prevotella histicola TaxID=470565 RepID=UPI0028891DA1|nr:restriction endonuclease subunit S [Prevotella histicola]